jgi:hypothetical protein
MDNRCPVCRADLGKRRLSQAIVARMEIDCPRCKSTIRLNLHRAEVVVVMAIFGTIVALAAAAYWFRSPGLTALIVAAAMVGSLALPVLEKTWLRTWPRYVSTRDSPER